MNRRTFLHLSVSTNAAYFITSFQVLAQDTDTFRSVLSTSQDTAATLQQEVLGTPLPIGPEAALAWSERDFGGRRSVAEAAVGIEEDVLLEFVPSDLRELAATMQEHNVPIMPQPQEIQQVQVEEPPPAFVEAECPDKTEVLWDILLDSLGLLEEKELFQAVANTIEGFNEEIQSIAVNVESDDTDALIDGLFNVIRFFGERAVLQTIVQNLGERTAQRLLKALSLRLVPWVGWGYACTALGLSVYKHWPRLVCA
jgi:hypothetical protein